MQRLEFDRLILEYAKAAGNPYVTTGGDFENAIDQRLQALTHLTRCLYTDAAVISFQPMVTAATGLASLRDTDIFAKPMFDVTGIIIDSAPISQITASYAAKEFPDYLTTSADQPDYYFLLPPQHIRFIARPASAYSNSFIQGYYVHPVRSGDADELEIPNEYTRCFAAAIGAIDLLEPYALEGALQIMAVKEARLYRQLMEAMDYAGQLLTGGDSVRGHYRGSRYVNLG